MSRSMFRVSIFAIISVFTVVFYNGCHQNPSGKSPGEAMKMVLTAIESRDISSLRTLVYRAPGESDSEFESKLEKMQMPLQEKMMMKYAGAGFTVSYEKIFDNGTAEVGVVMYVNTTTTPEPICQALMRKDGNTWKYDRKIGDYNEEYFRNVLRHDPDNADAYYYIGRKIEADKPAEAAKCFRKYLKLAPGGFWDHIYLRMTIQQLERAANQTPFPKN